MNIGIDGKAYKIIDVNCYFTKFNAVFLELKEIIFKDGYGKLTYGESQNFYLFEDDSGVESLIIDYWEDMAFNNSDEFVTIVGANNLVNWATSEINAIKDFCHELAGNPENHFHNPESNVHDFDEEEFEEIYGFVPTIAYKS